MKTLAKGTRLSPGKNAQKSYIRYLEVFGHFKNIFGSGFAKILILFFYLPIICSPYLLIDINYFRKIMFYLQLLQLVNTEKNKK